jgi:hypothetical protein
MVTDVSTRKDSPAMHSALAAAQLLADSAMRSSALLAVAEILEQLAGWDTSDPAELGDADAAVCRSWAVNAGVLTAAAGTGWAGPVRDAVVELRAAARANDPAGRNPLLDDVDDQVER